jgi:hypothetical protein
LLAKRVIANLVDATVLVRLLPLAIATALLVPASVSAGVATLSVQEIPLDGERTLASPGSPFDFVGLHWRGTGVVEFRTRSAGGGWSPWRTAVHEDHHAPDPGEPATSGWRQGEGVWVGPADALQVRTRGHVRRVRSFTVRSPVVRIPLRAPAVAGEPGVLSRQSWQADESLVRGDPRYADSLRMVHVHHTATGNDYSPSESAAIVRAIQVYHVKGNGWNDIGYNALVDRFGAVYEGRAGGLARNVVGAHARGFNTGSFGVALIGDFTSSEPPPVALDALSGLIAWRLDVAHVDPAAGFTAISPGNERFAPGVAVSLRAVSGHRDTGATTCPGDRLYRHLGAITQTAAAIGLPKLYEPRVSSTVGGPVRFQARLSQALPWSVRVTDRLGSEVARGTGTGSAVDWTWEAIGATSTPHTWRIEAAGVTPAIGTLGSSEPAAPTVIEIQDAVAEPAVISPNRDGNDDAASVAYTISTDANVSAAVVDTEGTTLAELEPARWRRAGSHTIAFDGKGLPDGLYAVRLQARIARGVETTFDVPVAITRTLAGVKTLPGVFTPNDDGRRDELQVRFRLAREANVRVQTFRDGVWVATPFSGVLPAGLRVVRWDGEKRVGRARDGDYEVVVEATDTIATVRASAAFRFDATAPVVKLRARRAPARLWVSEPAGLTVRVNGAVRHLSARQRGGVRLRGIAEVRTLVAVARDRAGNLSRPLRRP